MKKMLGACAVVLFLMGAVASVQAADNLVLATGDFFDYLDFQLPESDFAILPKNIRDRFTRFLGN